MAASFWVAPDQPPTAFQTNRKRISDARTMKIDWIESVITSERRPPVTMYATVSAATATTMIQASTSVTPATMLRTRNIEKYMLPVTFAREMVLMITASTRASGPKRN